VCVCYFAAEGLVDRVAVLVRLHIDRDRDSSLSVPLSLPTYTHKYLVAPALLLCGRGARRQSRSAGMLV